MTRVLIRCDASLSMGSGHVMRCRTLARELEQRGAKAIFLCRRQPGDLINMLEQEFQVLTLHEQSLSACDGLKGRELYSAWLGCSQEADYTQCLEALAEAQITKFSWLVADHYGLDATWEMQMLSTLTRGEANTRLLAIDDLADRPHQADLLLDQNFFGEDTGKRYQGILPKHCQQILGPNYALLGPEYAQLHRLVPPRTELKRVLVFFGGVDPANLAGQALQALTVPELADLAVDVVLGHQNPHRQAVEELVSKRPQTTLHGPQPSLAGLIARADLAIGAGGATTWERACLSLPSIVISMAENQSKGVVALEHQNYVIHLGIDNLDISIRKSLINLIEDPTWLLSSSIRSAGLVDGNGAKIISHLMINSDV